MINIPLKFFLIPYNGKVVPNNNLQSLDLSDGANCQVFVYSFLLYFGIKIPTEFRSKELWQDKKFTKLVKKPKLFDIMFFNKNNESYGAHIGVFLGNDMVIHLSKKIGYLSIWKINDFKKYKQYKFFLGAKRVKMRLL